MVIDTHVNETCMCCGSDTGRSVLEVNSDMSISRNVCFNCRQIAALAYFNTAQAILAIKGQARDESLLMLLFYTLSLK